MYFFCNIFLPPAFSCLHNILLPPDSACPPTSAKSSFDPPALAQYPPTSACFRNKYPPSCICTVSSNFCNALRMSSILLVLLQFFGLPLLLVERAVNFAVDFSDDRIRRLLFCLPGKPVTEGLPSAHAFLAHCPLRDKLQAGISRNMPFHLNCPVDVSPLVFWPHAPSLWSFPLRLRSSPSHWIDKNFIISILLPSVILVANVMSSKPPAFEQTTTHVALPEQSLKDGKRMKQVSAHAWIYHGVAFICSVWVRSYLGNYKMATAKSRTLHTLQK